jgi:hypothetical protein
MLPFKVCDLYITLNTSFVSGVGLLNLCKEIMRIFNGLLHRRGTIASAKFILKIEAKIQDE